MTVHERPFGRYFEDFEPGDVYKHWPGKTITEADDHLFCMITMNHHPLHTDAWFAETQAQHGKNVVVGNLVYSLVLGMSVPDVSGSCIANLEVESLTHKLPTFHGDTIYAETKVLEKRASSSKPDRGIVSVESRGFNQRGEEVCYFRRKVLVWKRDAAPPSAPVRLARVTGSEFYGSELARIHHEGFGFNARAAGPRLLAELDHAGIRDGLVVELGCGSGIQTRIVTDAGFDVLGIDISAGMLELAQANAPRATYRHESLIDADLPRCVAVTAVGEPLNYLADPRAGLESLATLFARVHDALQPGGIFLFDLSMPGRGGPTGRHERFFHDDDWVLGMEQEEAVDGSTLRREQTFFVRASDGTYHRADECHVLTLYPEPDIEAALTRAGFTWTTDTEYLPDPNPKHRTAYGGWSVFIARPSR